MTTFLPIVLAILTASSFFTRNYAQASKAAGAYVLIQGVLCILLSGVFFLQYSIDRAGSGGSLLGLLYVVIPAVLGLALLSSGLGLLKKRGRTPRIIALVALLPLGCASLALQRWTGVPLWVLVFAVLNGVAPFVVALTLTQKAIASEYEPGHTTAT
jgi:hypothetical protein